MPHSHQFGCRFQNLYSSNNVTAKATSIPPSPNKGCLGFPCYCLCFEPVKARRQKPALMVCPHAGLPGWLAPTRLKEFE